MARKQKPPADKPSKAYLVSFGDTMTALLAFFIVLNSFAKDQTGANLYAGTGSFVNSFSSIGMSGGKPGDRSSQVIMKENAMPLYAIESPEEAKESGKNLGPDSNPDQQRVIDRQTESFKRFLTEIAKEFDVEDLPPTRNQIVFDSFEQLQKKKAGQTYWPLQDGAIEIASESIMKLGRQDFELEIIVWAKMPSQIMMKNAIEDAVAIKNQIDRIFKLTDQQKARLTVSGKPWLFTDAARPKVSFVLSLMDLDVN